MFAFSKSSKIIDHTNCPLRIDNNGEEDDVWWLGAKISLFYCFFFCFIVFLIFKTRFFFIKNNFF